MSGRNRQSAAAPAAMAEPEAPAAPLPTGQVSDSVPVGPLRLTGIVRTRNGFAVAMVELSVEEWAAIAHKQLGRSQTFKEHIAGEHKKVVMSLGQRA